MSTDPEVLDKIKRACSPQKAIYDMAEYMGGYDADIIKAENAANTALGQANSAYNRATEALNGVSRMEQQVEDSVIELTDRVNGSTVTIVGNKNSGASTEVTLPVSSRLQAGVMNSATYATLDELGNRVTALESNTVTYLVTLPNDNPTQAEINSAYQTAYPTAPFPPNDGTTVIDQGKQLFYRYVKNGNLWIKTTGFTISQWTNDTLGTVKGSTTPGQIQAETDGTGSLVGYDVMVANIASNTDAIRANQASIKTLQEKDIDLENRIDLADTTIGRAIEGIEATPAATEFTITAYKIVGTSESVTINPVNSQYAGIVTPAMFNAWNSGGGSKIQTHYNIDVSDTNALSPLVLITDKNNNAVQFYVTYTPTNNKLIISFQYIDAVIIAQNNEGFNYKRTSVVVPSLSFVNNNMPSDGNYEDNIIVNLFKRDGSAVCQVALHYEWNRTDSTTTPTQIIDASAIAF